MVDKSLRALSRLESPRPFAIIMGSMMILALVESFIAMLEPSLGKVGFVLGFAAALLTVSYWSYRVVFAALAHVFLSRAPIILEVLFWLCFVGGAIALIGFPMAEARSFPANYHVFATVGGCWAAARVHGRVVAESRSA